MIIMGSLHITVDRKCFYSVLFLSMFRKGTINNYPLRNWQIHLVGCPMRVPETHSQALFASGL